MKKILLFLTTVFILFSLAVSAFADEAMTDPVVDGETVTEEETPVEVDTSEDILVGVDYYSLSPITAEDATGLKAVLLSFIGDYDPIIVEYEYQNANNSYSSYLREVQIDYVWLCSCAVLVLFIFCLFRLGGALLCRK